MSRGFVKDGDQEEVPVVTPRAFLPSGVPNYVTPEGLQALHDEKTALINERDTLTGNETDRRITYNYINAKLDLLEERIKTAVLVKVPPKETIGFGSYITIKMSGSAANTPASALRQTLRITGADEADATRGFISHFSPLAKALLGHRTGEGITVTLPSGTQAITILSVSSDPAPAALPAPASSTPSTPCAVTPSLSTNNTHDFRNNIPKSNMEVSDNKPFAAHASAPAATAPRHDDPNEIFPLVNERGITVGRAPRWQCHSGTKLLHPVVHLHVYNSRGELFLQKRPDWKDIQPGRWDTSVGGHMKFGETPEAALKREAREELGIENYTPKFIKKYIFESPREKELVHVYTTIYDGPITPSEELATGRFWTREEIKAHKGQKLFTPNFESEYPHLPTI